MPSTARADMVTAPHAAVFPSLTVAAFNLSGDGLRDTLDPAIERRWAAPGAGE